jgi:ATP-dependent Zn protease
LDSAVVSLVIEASTGEKPLRSVAAQVASTLSFTDLPIAIRIGWSAEQCLARLERATGPGPSAALAQPARNAIRIEELYGFGAAKDWALGLLHDIRAYRRGELRWADFDNYGLLLSGPPGTGKTAFAAALAGSAEIPLIATSTAEWHAQKYLSGTLAMIRSKFSEARKSAPCVMFVDELDGLGDRAALTGEHVEYWSQIINCVLEEMTKPNDGVILIAATNLPQRIDPAVLRSGRLDRHIVIGLPGHEDLRGIFRLHLGAELADADLLPLALMSMGATGADVAAWVKRARGRARRAGRGIEVADLLHEIQAGRFTIPPEERRRVAVHESGHVLCARLLGVGKVAGAAIGNRGGTTTVDLDYNGAALAEDIERQIDVLLGGRAAEVVVMGEAGIGSGLGPTSDLNRATQLAVMLETEAGAGEMGLVCAHGSEGDVLRNPLLFSAVRKRLAASAARASALLGEHRDILIMLSQCLDRRGYLAAEEIETIISTHHNESRAS